MPVKCISYPDGLGSSVVVVSFFYVPYIVCGGSVLVFVLLCITSCAF